MALSEDYWTLRQWLSVARGEESVLFMGDSVIWGQYARPGETLTACLNGRMAEGPRCRNAGLDGGHPVGLRELVRSYAPRLAGQRVVVYFNPLWLSAPLFEMQGSNVQFFFHARLLPQFDDTLLCYKAGRKERIEVCLERVVPLLQLERHWRLTWLDGKPWAGRLQGGMGATGGMAIARQLPAPEDTAPVDPIPWQRGGGKVKGTAWSNPEKSRQVAAFFDFLDLLHARGAGVWVLVGAYNTHMLPPENVAVYEAAMAQVRSRLEQRGERMLVLPVLASELYGDASHPLPAGYAWLADHLLAAPAFREWLGVRALFAAHAQAPQPAAAPSAPAGGAAHPPVQVRIEGGSFVMGDAQGREDETPHAVRVGPFLMDPHPVTQAFYESVMGRNPARHKGPDLPVEQVRWAEAAEFCNRCSERESLKPCYDLARGACDVSAPGYRLPTEAEWEFACRAGTTNAYFVGSASGLDAVAWFKSNAGGKTRPVGQKAANPWGLRDMAGNVWEWCNDWYGPYAVVTGEVANPAGPPTGTFKVLRGGAFDSPPERCRSAYRFKAPPHYQDVCEGYNSFGFRRVRSHAPASFSKGGP
jgi:formylglycine-generating enzyme required for sulfatase activity